MSDPQGSEALKASAGPRAFSLTRWFASIGLVSIALLAVIGALLLSRLFEERMLRQEGLLTMQFVQGVIDVEDAAAYFDRPQSGDWNYMEQLLAHIARSPDVLRTNLYSRERRVVWSSDPTMSGRSFAGTANPELDAALAGEFSVHEEEAHDEGEEKAEHANLAEVDGRFIELYVPVWDPDRRNVVGAVELYRSPRLLRESISSGVTLIWAGAASAAALLYLALLPLVRRADGMIRDQQERLVQAETLAAMGDLGSAVAHGVRNPLAVIRTSAELVKERTTGADREAASEIMDQVDRLEHWVRELLTYVHLPAGDTQVVNLGSILRASLDQFASELRRRGIEANVDLADGLPQVQGDSILVAQVFRSLLSNAVEAMPQGGRITIGARVGSGGRLTVELQDNGVGMSETQLKQALKPFHSTKAKGLGIGLPLARRIVERMGGTISLASTLGKGTSVQLTFPTVPA